MDADVSKYGHPTTQKFLKSFITEYKCSPELWNRTDPNHSNKYRRLEAQDRLLAIYKTIQKDATRVDVRKKINTLRSNYNKELIKIRKAEAEGREYIPKNWLFHELRFLDTNKKSQDNLQKESTDNEDSVELVAEVSAEDAPQIKIETYIVQWKDKDEPIAQVLEEPPTEIPKPHPKTNEEPKTNAHRVAEKNREEPNAKKHNQRFQQRSSTTGIEPIALVWSSKLQKLRPNQRLYAEKVINDVLFEAYLNNLGKGPVTINPMISSVTNVDPEGFALPEVSKEYIQITSSDDDEI